MKNQQVAPPDRPEPTPQVMKVKGACPTCGYLPAPEPCKTDQEIDEAFPPPTVGEVWKASDGRRLRVVGHGRNGRIACRNAETNRLSYVQRRYFHGATDGNWSLQRENGDVAVAPRELQGPARGARGDAVGKSPQSTGLPSTDAIWKLLNDADDNKSRWHEQGWGSWFVQLVDAVSAFDCALERYGEVAVPARAHQEEKCSCEIRHDFNCPIHNDLPDHPKRGPNGDE